MSILQRILIALILTIPFVVQAQCDVKGTVTITICDMTIIDGDGDTFSDGIINLYDEYFNATGDNVGVGTWFDPNFDFVLDQNTGDVRLWGLFNSSEAADDYTYILYQNGCPDPALTINVLLGAFSGEALPSSGPNSVNAQVCNSESPCTDIEPYNLFETLQTTPSPHLNGAWIYEGSSPNFVEIDGSDLYVDIPYQPGGGINEETFTLTYVVPGIGTCDPEMRTDVRISVVRRPSTGESTPTRICEQDIIDGVYDVDIALSNDLYLVDEDLEGTWSGSLNTGGEVSSPADQLVNIRNLYNTLIGSDPRFGYGIFTFKYSAKKRSGVCFDSETEIPFIIFETLRPFNQVEDRVICRDGSQPATIDLMTELEFTTENGVTYNYLPGDDAVWSFLSGPNAPPLTDEGVIDLTGLGEGTYVFGYDVDADINCNGNCPTLSYKSNECTSSFSSSTSCGSESAEVRIVITDPLYAGEDTANVELCRDGNPIDLIALLETNGTSVYRGANGEWTDSLGNVIPNNFVAPTVVGNQTYDFTYTTTNNVSCIEEAQLSLNIFEPNFAGNGTSTEFCSDASIFNLYDLLTGIKNNNGTWTGPGGYSETFMGSFDPNVDISGAYVYTVPTNGPCQSEESIVNVIVNPRPNAGIDISSTICQSEGLVDVFGLLDSGTDMDGEFYIASTNTLVDQGILDLSTVSGSSLGLEYRIDRSTSCAPDLAVVQVNITAVEAPTVSDQSYCVLEGATLRSVAVISNFDYIWYETAVSEEVLNMDTVLEDKTYYIANVDQNGCESVRVPMMVTIFNIGATNDCKPDLMDGVSPNNDGINDVLDLGDLENAFPGFQISIYNRYGTLVYKGRIGTSYFSGLSNVSPSLGDDLPSGVYFYVFEPNDNINGAFQDTFYLSK
ncbi:gliding motility-associated C-terminal domain-containing protein [Flavobacteriaceae bacterium KMM 6898]|nr:gliding motility-associated C-terminal domain-containing protein [Flavobacteriaceae bacterium KMM 6898]